MAEEVRDIREIHHHDHESSSGIGAIIAVIVGLLIVGFLIWNFLPARSGANRTNINVELPNNSSAGTGGGQ